MIEMNSKQRFMIWVLAMVLISAGTLLRVRLSADLPLDADESIAGLMARNIAFEGESPMFLYGENYVGSAMQFVVGGMFRLFGFHSGFIRWPEYALVALFLFLGFTVSKKTGSAESGIWTLLFLAIPPVFLTIINLKSWGNYNETFCLGAILWWLSLSLTSRDDPGGWRCGLQLFAWGLAFGLGFWIHFPIVIYAIPCGLWLLWYGRGWLFPLRWIATLAGFLIGWFPALWYNLTHNWANLGYAAKGGWDYLTRIEMSGKLLVRIFEQGFPFLLGVRDDSARFIEFDQFDPLFAKVLILGGVIFAVLLHLFRSEIPIREWLEESKTGCVETLRGEKPTGLIPVGMILLTLLFAMYGRWGGGSFTPRYYTFLMLPLFVILGQGMVWCRSRFLLGSLLWAGLFLYSNLFGHVTFLNHPPDRTAEKVTEFLEEEGVPAVFTDYWIAHTVTYLTNEEIIGSVHGGPVRHERYPRYTTMAEEAEEGAYALYNDYDPDLIAPVKEDLEELGVTYEEKVIDNVTVFYNLSRKVNPDELNLYYRY